MKYELPKEAWVEVDSMELPNLFIGTDKFGKTMYLQKQLIPTKPKVSLEELVAIFARHWGHDTTPIDAVTEICAHLGIELEEPKEEWPMAMGAIETIDSAIELASTPLKEFPPGSSMDKDRWELLEWFLKEFNENGNHNEEIAACRQISESLQ